MRDCAEWKNILPSAADFVGVGFYPALGNPHFETDIRRGDPMWSPESVTLDPVRDCAERKNIIPSADAIRRGDPTWSPESNLL